MTRRPRTLLIGLVAGALLLTGCASDPLAEQYREGSSKGFIAGDGSWTEIPVADRGNAVTWSGADETGAAVTSEDYAGKVVVVNFWYASCAPCRAEAPALQKLNAEFAGTDALWLGVNVRDQAANAIAFNESFGITYPSVMDVDNGSMQLAFSGSIPPNAVPTTLVLDRSGRVAARILGSLTSPSILETLVRDTIAEES
ncbi:TlpA family protein disulfide reductase [Cryobacterium sp. TMT1-21]|uniref:TlpA family protein disulfide reductase n=1 Tax=Cryobacterium shii TaxID=1259235 RepID=A0AAQ2HF11_9MICO|nr:MULTISPECIES: TlpA disulfide reductase family protein [Cryobacterium]TFC45612.1 TlpA family protein disulfide reductase [Cryobacterium shii]TFC85780.1 TlpA family protein disulfide reductase [Cryobacterium sp. TmT2-59]TFD16479.1 TlpA family protein disulfide reductase [Cryobacterium sp. TMT1-21]TFD16927.1 TlpA family protein disulfide reductase [Cryobacterium sp. TMT4-10]TFD23603.1 TlpA family protein disulfide reductase [Cryobacterium sp. TMT2-23]